MQRLTLLTVFAAALATGCAARVGYRASVSGEAYGPDLVYVAPGVQVIADYDQPIFYADNFYLEVRRKVLLGGPGTARRSTPAAGSTRVRHPSSCGSSDRTRMSTTDPQAGRLSVATSNRRRATIGRRGRPAVIAGSRAIAAGRIS